MLHQSQRTAKLAALALCAFVVGLFFLQTMPAQNDFTLKQATATFTSLGNGYCRDATGEWPVDDHTTHCSLELSECKRLCVEKGCPGILQTFQLGIMPSRGCYLHGVDAL
jgi:hypothetical protein